ncbi:MAG: bifunctional demethylmenaquinone methyltransferase/2-methoxy-6-polyprenyl-1,4-benzoquinol methylase UbiE [Calditrichaeota bacterium]|nr:MAG: bifunctional demethylmenaquinone methyltransferase/2-methoxy-6-polyprenyl-1,4-benzoquinol methylase UbiE [Calditrichota bacterium]
MKNPSPDNHLTSPIPPRTAVWRMFDRIAHRYDLLNRLLSFRQDVVWRKRVVNFLPERNQLHVLDLATGTGDLLIALQENSTRVASGVGIDLAEKMLEIGREKLRKKSLDERLTLQKGDAMAIPFPENTFDVVTIAFGIRNVEDVEKSLKEMYRVLKNKGRVLILEFSLPENRIFRAIYLFYFRNILPRIGGWISGDSTAYRYLNRTVETFPYGKEFCRLLQSAGFKEVSFTPLTFGIATIYQGDKVGEGSGHTI